MIEMKLVVFDLCKVFNRTYLLAFFIGVCYSLFPITVAAVTIQDVARTITIKAVPGLKYDRLEFQVKPGEKIKLVLVNDDDMSHNLIITKPGKRLEIVNLAMQLAEKGPGMNYIPRSSNVLWTIPVISPGQSKSITFIAPKTPGTYPYVCTYPGHGFIMFGNMKVVANVMKTPAKAQPPTVTQVDSVTQAHPYSLNPPYAYRAFVEAASPAALSVHLPNNLSYCWDLASCRLRFAWQGEFLDNSDLWKGHFDASAKVLGDVFFRDYTDYPITIGEDKNIPQIIKYKGYRLINRYPEFHYTINGVNIYELILPKEDGSGLIRKFRISPNNQIVFFHVNRHDESMKYESSTGEWEGASIKLQPHESQDFTITMTSYHLLYKRKRR